jgi:hypothetical protein
MAGKIADIGTGVPCARTAAFHLSTFTASSTLTSGTPGISPRTLATYRSRLCFADTDEVDERLPDTMRERVIPYHSNLLFRQRYETPFVTFHNTDLLL